MVLQHWLGFLLICWTDCRGCWMPPRDWFTGRSSMTMWLRFSRICIGCVFRNVSRFGLLYQCTVVSMELLRYTLLWTSPCSWCRVTTAAASSRKYSVGRAKYSTLHDRRPFLSCSSCSSLEQSSAAYDIITVFRRRLKTELFTRSYDLN